MDRASNATIRHIIKSLNEIIQYDEELNNIDAVTLENVIDILERLRD